MGGDSLSGSLRFMRFGEWEYAGYAGMFFAHSLVWVFGDGCGSSVGNSLGQGWEGMAGEGSKGADAAESLDGSRVGADCGWKMGIAVASGGEGEGGVLLFILS